MPLNLSKLNKQQLQAVKHNQGPALVVAGAGTGKTQVITHRIAYLIEKGLAKESQIVALTFTDKAAKEMETRVSELLGKYVFDVNITTFNAFGYEILKRFGYDIGLNTEVKVLNQQQQLVFLAEHLEELGLDYYSPVTNPEGLLGELLSYFSTLKNQLIWPKDYLDYTEKQLKKAKQEPDKQEAERQLELARAYKTYQQLCRRYNVIDFDDQVYLCVELLKTRPNVLKKLQAEYTHWLVDEFQDTNLAQAALLDLLAASKANIMVVGDDDQCIYRFRGAALANILDFNKRYPKAKQIALLQNYRSSQQILDAAYQLIQNNNPDRLESRYNLNKRLAGSFSAKAPQFKSFSTQEEEAAWLAGDIKARLKRGQKPSQIAVLLRKNAQAKSLERYLLAEDIPFSVAGQAESLYKQPEVLLLLRWLRVVADPSNSEDLYHLLTSAVYGVDGAWLRQFTAAAKRQHTPLEELLQAADNTPPALQQLLVQLAGWRRQLSQLSVGQLCYRFLEDSGYLKQLVKQAKSDPSLDAAVRNLNQFFKSLLDYERIAEDASAIGYLQHLPTLASGHEQMAWEESDIFAEQVRLMSVHRAKGLEFETVYLFDMSQGSFPAQRLHSSLEAPEVLVGNKQEPSHNPQLAEERRLMYVAMTRAKRNLILTYSADHGGKRPKQPSIFIEEALGEQALSGLGVPKTQTTQIELFGGRSVPKQLLPPTIYQGKEIVLTVAQVEDYLMCPAEFYVRHILQPPSPFSLALAYGTLIHMAIQQYNRRKLAGQTLSLSELKKQLKQNWPAEGFKSQAHSKRSLDKASKGLTRFYRREQRSERHVAHVEKAFTLKLGSQPKLRLNGRLDAVYEDAVGVEIRDYKTGAYNVTSQAKADERAKQSLQLGIYALAWSHLKGVIPDVVSLDFIDAGFVGRASKTPRQLETVAKKIQQVAAGVEARDFKPGGSHIFCSHQEYGI